MPHVIERTRAVRAFRAASNRSSTVAIAAYPEKYNVEVLPTESFLVVPKVSSIRREYLPIGWVEPPTIPSDLVFVLNSASKATFGLLTSAMHMSWLRYIGGRLKSDYRYAIGQVYNTFPLPPATKAELNKLEPLAQAVLDARTAHTSATLADLYDPDLMPANLRKAHQALDRAVDKLYRKSGFSSDSERVEHLLGLYEKMVVPLTTPKRKPKRNA